MPLVQVVIDDSTSKTITGLYTFDRDNGGTLVGGAGTSFPGTPETGEWFWRSDENKLYRYNGSGWDAVVAAVAPHDLGGSDHNADTLANLNSKVSDATLDDSGDPRTPTSHASSHQNGGSDEVATATPAANAIPKAGAGGDLDGGWMPYGSSAATVCEGNDARLSDARTPTSHASSHQNGGGDEISVAGLSGTLADDQPPEAHAIDGAKHTGSLSHSALSGITATDHHAHPSFSVHDGLGNQTFTGSTTLNLDTIDYTSGGSYYTLASDEITIVEAGVYCLVGHVTLDVSVGTNRAVGGAQLQRDEGSGFNAVPGANAFLYNRNTAAGENTGALVVILDVAAGDKFRVRLTRIAGSSTLATKVDSSGLAIWRVQ